MRSHKFQLLIIISLLNSSCAITSGLQTYDLPKEGNFQTDLGTNASVIKLTQETMPSIQVADMNSRQDFAHLFQSKHKSYTLTPGDILSIYLWAYPEITPPTNTIGINNVETAQSVGYQIDQNGYIDFPIIGRVKVSGKTVHQVNRDIKSQLARYLKTPDVIVRVLSYQGQRYSVQGNVMKGGQYTLNDQPTSVYTALGLAGGVNTQLGNSASITLVRQGRSYELNNIELEKLGFSLHNLLIQPNDTIYVNNRENQKIYVMGEATKNQSFPLRDQGMSLSDVLGESLGLNPNSANKSKIYVVRTNPVDRTTQIYHLNLKSIGDFGLANQFNMRSNDIVYVDATGLTRWQRVVNQVIPFSSFLYNFDRLGQ
ncbi:polysaccharide biosynthesis/export family protein [Acinetobacter shaoyimingii]|uniref:Soluble ligand binding domain-containing protein n=1 Tax=Acinetobacter shaoyimingii TaxID=2715164 RepID=A0A6G8RS49_9GAMM|nr:polysaccharide biosynthesis/export family protein [Acinetobacter shaoyimingii]NHB56944.1 hypothetical protein [Acinetobacter shaoyimingii]QIO04543.1 hypothetical protein G8E00_00495 [Acinetobacter shaoyimingii]